MEEVRQRYQSKVSTPLWISEDGGVKRGPPSLLGNVPTYTGTANKGLAGKSDHGENAGCGETMTEGPNRAKRYFRLDHKDRGCTKVLPESFYYSSGPLSFSFFLLQFDNYIHFSYNDHTMEKTTRLSSTELKRNTAEVLNSVAFGKVEAIVERYGEPLVKIIPMRTTKKKHDFKEALDEHFGAIPNFPDVCKSRHFRRRSTKL